MFSAVSCQCNCLVVLGLGALVLMCCNFVIVGCDGGCQQAEECGLQRLHRFGDRVWLLLKVTQMAHQFEDLRAVVAAQAQQLHYLQHGKSTTPSGSFDDDEVSSDEDSD
ncbi:hypothetical protein QQ045_031452 [Rhodiola kirilowii]